MSGELEQLTALFAGLGANPSQARTMAAQVRKRCDQWVQERGISREEAMASLLQFVIKGHKGETPPGFEATSPPSAGSRTKTR